MVQLVSIICIAVLVAADQLIKAVVSSRLMPIGSADFIPGIIGVLTVSGEKLSVKIVTLGKNSPIEKRRFTG